MLHVGLRPYCTHHVHQETIENEKITCDHVLPRFLFKSLFGRSAYKCSPAKVLLDSSCNKQALPRSANNAAAFLLQEALALRVPSPGIQNSNCACLDCVFERLLRRRSKPLKYNLQQGIVYLQDPSEKSLRCYKFALCRTFRELWRKFPQQRAELDQIACKLKTLVTCRANKYISFCLLCNLPKKRKKVRKFATRQKERVVQSSE